MTPYEILHNMYTDIDSILNRKIQDRKEIIRQHLLYEIMEKWHIFFELDSINKGGVYFISNYYIGRSDNMLKRISYHILDGYSPTRPSNANISKSINIENEIKLGKLKVKVISDNPDDEEKLIRKYSKNYNLSNIEFNTNIDKTKHILNKTKREVVSIDIAEDHLPDKGNLVEFQLLRFKSLYKYTDTKSGTRKICKIYNTKSKMIGFNITKSKYGIIDKLPELNQKIKTDYYKYGPESFEIEFTEYENCDDKKIELIKEQYDKDITKLYNNLNKTYYKAIGDESKIIDNRNYQKSYQKAYREKNKIINKQEKL